MTKARPMSEKLWAVRLEGGGWRWAGRTLPLYADRGIADNVIDAMRSGGSEAVAVSLLPTAELDALRAEVERLRVALPAIRGTEPGDGGWLSCTGCYETSDGHNVFDYPYSSALGCIIGSGCRECGGLGATWEPKDYPDYAQFAAGEDRAEQDRKRAARLALIEECARAAEQTDRVGREWVAGSLWDSITKRAAGAVRALAKAGP